MTTNLRFYLLHNCENYRNIDFSVINKDRGNWVKVVIRSNSCVISLVKIFIFIEWLYSTPKVYVMYNSFDHTHTHTHTHTVQYIEAVDKYVVLHFKQTTNSKRINTS